MEITGTEATKERPAKKRGRPPKNAVAMTPAERKAASRLNRKQKEQDAEREDLIAALIKQADFSKEKLYLQDLMELSIEELREHKKLIAALMEIYRGKQAHIISKVQEHRRIAGRQELQHLRELTRLSLEDLRLALKGLSDLPDTRGRLANERMSGKTGTPEIERIAVARERNAHGRRVVPRGEGPDT